MCCIFNDYQQFESILFMFQSNEGTQETITYANTPQQNGFSHLSFDSKRA